MSRCELDRSGEVTERSHTSETWRCSGSSEGSGRIGRVNTRPRWIDDDFAVIDLETTGLDPLSDSVVSVAVVPVRGGRVLANQARTTLVDPQVAIPAAATAIHGITDSAVRGAPTLAQAIADIEPLLDNSVVVGHNVDFDLAFLAPYVMEKPGNWTGPGPLDRRDSPQPGLFTLNRVVPGRAPSAPGLASLDTLAISRLLFPHPAERHNLNALADRFGVTVHGRHTSLGDAMATAQCLVRSLPILEQRGWADAADVNHAMRARQARLAALNRSIRRRSIRRHSRHRPRRLVSQRRLTTRDP